MFSLTASSVSACVSNVNVAASSPLTSRSAPRSRSSSSGSPLLAVNDTSPKFLPSFSAVAPLPVKVAVIVLSVQLVVAFRIGRRERHRHRRCLRRWPRSSAPPCSRSPRPRSALASLTSTSPSSSTYVTFGSTLAVVVFTGSPLLAVNDTSPKLLPSFSAVAPFR